MKSIILILSLLICFNTSKAQNSTITSTISVKGNCEECKERIENAADIKGVKNAVWNMDTKTLIVIYDTKKVSLQKIEKAIAKAGHQTTTQNADSTSYNALPNCCKYQTTNCIKKE